jgi:hypothetical protein
MKEIKKEQEVVDMLYELSAYISTALRDAGSKKKFKKAIEQTGGGVPRKYPPEYYRPCCTPAYLDPNYIKLLLRTFKRLSANFPDLIGEFNMLPKVLEKYFTDGIFDSLLQQCLCEKIKKLLMNDPQFMTFMEVAFKTYPMGVRFKKQFVDRPEKANLGMFFNNFQQLFELKETRHNVDDLADSVRKMYNAPSNLVKSWKEGAEKNKQTNLENAIDYIDIEIGQKKQPDMKTKKNTSMSIIKQKQELTNQIATKKAFIKDKYVELKQIQKQISKTEDSNYKEKLTEQKEQIKVLLSIQNSELDTLNQQLSVLKESAKKIK